MSKVCEITGKSVITGNKVSHSNRKTRRVFEPNLFKKKFFVPETGEWVTLKVSTSGIRNITKMGITAALEAAKLKGYYNG